MKKLVTATLIPALAAIAVIGSGFSVFYFGNEDKTTNMLNSKVENVLTTGELTGPTSMELHFDQTAATRAIFSDKITSEANGIYLANAAGDSTALSIKYTKPQGENVNDSSTGLAKKVIQTYILVPEVYLNYLAINKGTGISGQIGESGYLKDDLSDVDPAKNGKTFYFGWDLTGKDGDIEMKLPALGSTTDDALFTFSYATYNKDNCNPYSREIADFTVNGQTVTTNEPTSVGEYNKMKTDLEGADPIKIVSRVTLTSAD